MTRKYQSLLNTLVRHPRKLWALTLVLAFGLGVGANSLYIYLKRLYAPLPISIVRQDGYQFISPLLRCDSIEPTRNSTYQKLSNDIENLIGKNHQNGWAKDVAVYFRILNTADWFTINDQIKYTPASLLKLPIFMALYKRSEIDPTILSRSLVFDGGSDNWAQRYQPAQELEENATYTYEDLAGRMITESDNTAKNLLLSRVSDAELTKIFTDIKINPLAEESDFITVSEYASFFRSLFSATYLNNENSEKALNILSRVEFSKGLTAPLPKNLTVAHKFGERSVPDSNDKQLHECAIVYYPGSPYLLCVMTHGYEFSRLESILQTISKKAYEAIDSQNKTSKVGG